MLIADEISKIQNEKLREDMLGDEKYQDSTEALKKVKRWRNGAIFLRVLASIFTLGAIPIIYFLFRKLQSYSLLTWQIGAPMNWITIPYHQTIGAINGIESLIAAGPEEPKDSVDVEQELEKVTPPQKEPTKQPKPNDETKATHYEAEAIREPLSGTILSNGHIARCDKITMTDGTIHYCLGIYHGKYGISDDPFISRMAVGNHVITMPNPIAKKFIPFFDNNQLLFFVHDGNNINIVNTQGNIVGEAVSHASDDMPNHLIPYKIGNKHAFLIEIGGKEIHHHQVELLPPKDKLVASDSPITGRRTVDLSETVRTSSWSAQTIDRVQDPVNAATYCKFNSVLYFCADGELFFSSLENSSSHTVTIDSSPDLKSAQKLAVSENGKHLVVATQEGQIHLFDASNIPNFAKGCELQDCYPKHIKTFTIENAKIFDLRFVEDDKDILVVTNKDAVRVNNFEEKLQDKATFSL